MNQCWRLLGAFVVSLNSLVNFFLMECAADA